MNNYRQWRSRFQHISRVVKWWYNYLVLFTPSHEVQLHSLHVAWLFSIWGNIESSTSVLTPPPEKKYHGEFVKQLRSLVTVCPSLSNISLPKNTTSTICFDVWTGFRFQKRYVFELSISHILRIKNGTTFWPTKLIQIRDQKKDTFLTS